MKTKDYKVYGVCPKCGYYVEAPFGKLFHIWADVCPNCGTPKSRWSLQTARLKCLPLKRKWWIFSWTRCNWILEIKEE